MAPSFRRCSASRTTMKAQCWALPAEGARIAASRIFVRISSGTGSGLSRRSERAEYIASNNPISDMGCLAALERKTTSGSQPLQIADRAGGEEQADAESGCGCFGPENYASVARAPQEEIRLLLRGFAERLDAVSKGLRHDAVRVPAVRQQQIRSDRADSTMHRLHHHLPGAPQKTDRHRVVVLFAHELAPHGGILARGELDEAAEPLDGSIELVPADREGLRRSSFALKRPAHHRSFSNIRMHGQASPPSEPQ